MTLMDIYTGGQTIPVSPAVSGVHSRKIKTVSVGGKGRKVSAVVLRPEDFGGEYKRNGILYLLVLWLASFWAMITNSLQAVFIMIFRKRGKSFKSIMWDMGRDPNHVSSFFGDRFSHFNHQSIAGAAGWLSLDIFYNYWEKVEPKLKRDFEGFITRFWIGRMANRQAVTNRFKIVVNLLVEAFGKFREDEEIRILSIASGSAQAVIAAIKRCPHLNIKAMLVDPDKEALAQAQKSAEEAGLQDHFIFVRGTHKRLNKVCQEFLPHIIEMVGLLDYLGEEEAVDLIGKIKQNLPEGGIFLTCNIRSNPERIFLYWVMLWPMIYRSEEELSHILLAGGFSPDKIRIFYEPFRIHGIGLCQV